MSAIRQYGRRKSEPVRADRAGLCLPGSTDTVPTDGRPWTAPPLALTTVSHVTCKTYKNYI